MQRLLRSPLLPLRLLLLWLCVFANLVYATNNTPTIHYFLDTHANLTIDDLQNNPTDIAFHVTDAKILAAGFSRYPLWLKLQLTADNTQDIFQLDSFLLEQIDWYQLIDNATTQSTTAPSPIIQAPIIQHTQIEHPLLLSNQLAITPAVNSTVWVRITSKSAIHLSASLTTTTQYRPATNLSLLVFAITLSMGIVGVILHTQSQQQRLSLLSLQSLLLVLSGLNLPVISSLGYTANAMTASLLLIFLLRVSNSAQEQSWWSIRQLRIIRGLILVLLLANFWTNAPLNSTLLLLLSVLSYALWAPFAHIHITRSTLKICFSVITTDLLLWIICFGIISLQTGWWPYPQHSELAWNIITACLSVSLGLLQIRSFMREHRNIHSPTTTHTHFLHQQQRDHKVFSSFSPQPVAANETLLRRVKSGMRQEDGNGHLHDHLSVIQQEITTPHLVAHEQGTQLLAHAFNLRVLGHELLQAVENLAYSQQTPVLFAIKPGTHTHLIGPADAFMTLLQQLTKHSLQQSLRHQGPKKNINAISVRIEDEGLFDTANHAHHQYPVLLKSHLRDSNCLSEEQTNLLNQNLSNFTDQQHSQLQQDYPYLLAAKHLVEQLYGQLQIYSEGASTTCYTITLPMQSAQAHQPEPPKSFLTLKNKKILLMTYDSEYGMTMAEQASGQDIPLSLALSISQARRNLQHSHQTDAQFDLLVLDCSQAEETLQAFISEIHSSLPGYAHTPLLLLHVLTKTLPQGDHFKHASKPSAFVQLGALITSLLSKPTTTSQPFLAD